MTLRLFGAWFSTLLFLGGTPSALAEDLDVNGARQRYETQRRIADSARQRMDSAQASLQAAQNTLNFAQQAESQAVRDKDYAENTLSSLENEIAQLNRDLDQARLDKEREQRRLEEAETRLDTKRTQRDELARKQDDLERRVQQVRQRLTELENATGPGKWTCVAVDHGWEEHSGGHPGKGGDRAEAEAKAREACKVHHGECDISSCEKNSAEIAEVRQRLERLTSDRDEVARRLRDLDNEISNLDYERERLRQSVFGKENDIRDKTYRLSDRTSARDRQIRVVSDTYEALRRARQSVDVASAEVSALRPPYLSLKSAFEYEDRLATEAYTYYQTVLNNYQSALNSVYAKADAAAGVHGAKEASERASRQAETDGRRAGQIAGTQKANVDARARDYLKGYLEGRQLGATDPVLSSAYDAGSSDGALAARKKARVESFPKGFNASLASHLAGMLGASVTMDISEELPSDPGGSPVLLRLAALAVGQGITPTAKTPPEPVIQAPGADSPSVSVPASLKAYYDPPCVALVLEEFGPLCEARYESGYLAQYQGAYLRIYREVYRRSFTPASEALYAEQLALPNTQALLEGRSVGAKEQGVLDGFQNNLLPMQGQEYAAGQTALGQELTKGALLIPRELKLEETTGDGLMTSGEPAKISLVMDNYGAQSSAFGKVRARLLSATGFTTVAVTTRELPALPGLTRTTLKGVLTLPVAVLAAGDKVKVDVAIDVNEGGGWKELSRLKTEAEIHFPVELTAVDVPANPKVGAKVKATFHFVNRLKTESPATQGTLSTSPAFVAFANGKVEIPALAAGAEQTVETEIEPGPWVGDNTYVNFVSDLTLGDGRTTSQILRKIIEVDRNVSLLLYGPMGEAVPSSTLVVRAGSIVNVGVELKYRAKGRLPGPFILRAAKVSNPVITHANGSTTSVNYGSLSPGTTLGRVNIAYQIPSSLAGKREWVMIQAEEGAAVQHAMMVYLDIR